MDCPYAVKQIQDLKITRKINEHATLSITGIMSQEEQGKCIETAGTHDKVFIYKTNNQGEKVNILFAEVVASLAIRHVKGIYWGYVLYLYIDKNQDKKVACYFPYAA